MRKFRFLCGAAAVLMAIAPASAQTTDICQPRHVAGHTHGAIRTSVEARAVMLWAGEVAAHYTPRSANWGNARDRGLSCRQYTSALGLNLWRCQASAMPCRLPD